MRDTRPDGGWIRASRRRGTRERRGCLRQREIANSPDTSRERCSLTRSLARSSARGCVRSVAIVRARRTRRRRRHKNNAIAPLPRRGLPNYVKPAVRDQEAAIITARYVCYTYTHMYRATMSCTDTRSSSSSPSSRRRRRHACVVVAVVVVVCRERVPERSRDRPQPADCFAIHSGTLANRGSANERGSPPPWGETSRANPD